MGRPMLTSNKVDARDKCGSGSGVQADQKILNPNLWSIQPVLMKYAEEVADESAVGM